MIAPRFLYTSGNIRADRRFEYACGLADASDLNGAIDLLLQTVNLVPLWPVIPFHLGKYYKNLGQNDEAVDYFEKSIELDPEDHQGAALELEQLGISAVQDIMPPAFVETLFDQYAWHFDRHLIETLDYKVPEMIAELTARIYKKDRTIRILDLGCGTGLAGEHLKEFACYMEGVDISGGMLEKASEKCIYNVLVQSEILEYLQSNQKSFDLVIAADVISYFGALESLAQNVCNVLTPGGHFIFSAQKLKTPPPDPAQSNYYLGQARRFSHSRNYIKTVIASAGMHVASLKEAVLRKDEGEDVNGYLIASSKGKQHQSI